VASRVVKFWQITNPMGEVLPGAFPATALVRRVKSLAINDLRHETPDEWTLLVQGLRERRPQYLCLYRIRHENLPFIERSGQFADLELAEDENLAEASHFRFFSRNVVGQLFNFDGPQVGRLSQYLAGVFDANVSFAPVLRRDAAQTLGRLTDPTIVNLAIPVDRAYLLEDTDDDSAPPPKPANAYGLLYQGGWRARRLRAGGGPAHRPLLLPL